MRETRNAYRIYVKPNLEARKHFEYLRSWNMLKWVKNCKGVYWIQTAQKSDQVQVLLNRVIKIQIL